MAEETIIIGGYTRKEGAGIYKAVLDTVTGSVSTPLPYVTGINGPTYLALSKANRLYTVAAGEETGGVAAVDLNGDNPRVLGSVLEAGTSPAHVSVDEDRQLVFAANYHEGRLNVYVIQDDGSLVATDEVTHSGKGPRPEQEASHVHFAGLTPDKRVVVVDLGNDTVSTYPVSEAGKLGEPTIWRSEPGFGPRHILFHPSKPIAYLLGELSSEVQVLDYDAATGSFSPRQTLRTIPADWTEHNGAAAIRISQDGRFLYTSNRGHNSIATFAIGGAGDLTFINYTSTFGKFPRDFNIDPSDCYLFAVNQNTDNGTLYRRDPVNGTLTTLAINIRTPEAVCVIFP